MAYNDWEVQGSIMEWDYDVVSSGMHIMHAKKQLFNVTDTYVLDIDRSEIPYCV